MTTYHVYFIIYIYKYFSIIVIFLDSSQDLFGKEVGKNFYPKRAKDCGGEEIVMCWRFSLKSSMQNAVNITNIAWRDFV